MTTSKKLLPSTNVGTRNIADEQELAASVRATLAGTGVIHEVRMFGGIGFMLNGNLVAGASRRGLLLRVGRDRQSEALAQPGARPVMMRGRAMEGYVYVDPPALNKRVTENLLRMAIAHVRTLPSKSERKPKQKRGGRK